MNSRFDKKDGEGNTIRPGDVCIRHKAGKLEYIVFKRDVWGTKLSKGEFGKFITSAGETSMKYSNVLFAFDPASARRPKLSVIRKFYEGK